MPTSVSDAMLEQLSELVAELVGLHFPREHWHDLEHRIRSAAKELGFKDSESCLQHLLLSSLSKSQIEILASHLTVGETYFFREKKSFEALEEHILPELIRSRGGKEKRLRIWSAGCCTGEEPYSIAVLLSRVLSDLKDWNITILATDINPNFLRKASQAEYTEWSFRGTPPWAKDRYFTRKRDGHYELYPHIKEMVTFSHLNLAEDVYPSLLNNTNAMDIIFCRNVLMYFTPERAKKTIQNLYLSLVDGGWLIVSPTETSSVLYSQFVTVNFSGATIYNKDGQRRTTASFFPYKRDITKAEALFPQSADTVAETLPEVSLPHPLLQVDRELLQLEAREKGSTEVQLTPYDEALALYQQGQYTEAIEKLTGLPSVAQSNAEAATLLARTYANQGKLNEALEWCEKAIATNRLNPGLYYLRAIILQEQGVLDEATISLRGALYLDQNFVLAHFALGNLARRRGKFKEAGKHFSNALSLSRKYEQDEILPESEGITAGRLTEIVQSTTCVEKPV